MRNLLLLITTTCVLISFQNCKSDEEIFDIQSNNEAKKSKTLESSRVVGFKVGIILIRFNPNLLSVQRDRIKREFSAHPDMQNLSFSICDDNNDSELWYMDLNSFELFNSIVIELGYSQVINQTQFPVDSEDNSSPDADYLDLPFLFMEATHGCDSDQY